MALNREVHDDIGAKTLADMPHCSRVANVGASERKSWIVSNAVEIIEIAAAARSMRSSVSQLIDDADLMRTLLNDVADNG